MAHSFAEQDVRPAELLDDGVAGQRAESELGAGHQQVGSARLREAGAGICPAQEPPVLQQIEAIERRETAAGSGARER